ncbi:hypothetical protein AC1031_000219 [Aphanomyces cochlioides]|nr:hypothetical protein AC1031_000219 [Aphanomyces cochlioides]
MAMKRQVQRVATRALTFGSGRRSISVLHLNASISEDSVTSVVSMGLMACVHQQSLRAAWTAKKNLVVNSSDRALEPFRAIERDLWAPDLPTFGKDTMQSSYRVRQGEGTEEDIARVAPIRALAQELLESDCVIISSPVWNHSVPYVVKQYIDCVVQPELTFCQTTQQPFVQGKTFILVTSAGGELGEQGNTAYSLVHSVFSGIGFNQGHCISLEGLKDPSKRDQKLDAALFEAERIAEQVVAYNLSL